jgi:LuxR family maltose regulon positive regulatory protein
MVSGMSFEDLAFQPEEIRQYFIQNVGMAISEDEAGQIAAETEGWIAAIHLTNALTPQRMPARPFSALADLFDFFTSEVLDKQTPELREFLLITSMFEAFDAELCGAVLDSLLSGEPRPWAKLIGVVQANNVFTVPLGDDGRWMRYHNMFKQFLASQLQYEQPTLTWHIQRNWHGIMSPASCGKRPCTCTTPGTGKVWSRCLQRRGPLHQQRKILTLATG